MRSEPVATCADVRRLLLDLARAKARPSAAVQAHLATCSACAAEVQTFRASLVATRAFVHADLSATDADVVWQRLQPQVHAKAQALRAVPAPALNPLFWRWAWWVAGAAVATFVVGAVWFGRGETSEVAAVAVSAASQPEQQPLRLARWQGEVDWRRPSVAGVRGLVASAPLALADHLRAGPASRFALTSTRTRWLGLADTHVEVGPASALAEEMKIHRGTLAVAPLPNASAGWLSVATPRLRAQAQGATFVVTTTPVLDEVVVLVGQVRVSYRERAARVVVAGASWRATLSGRELAVPLTYAQQAELAHVFDAEEGQPVLPQGLSTLRPVAAVPAMVRPRQRNLGDVVAPPEAPSELARRGDCQAALQLWEHSEVRHRDSEWAAELATVADCYRGSAQVEQALRLYERVARDYSQTPAGENAAFEAAQYHLERGATATSHAAFRSFVERYPRGPLHSEAVFKLGSLALQMGAGEEALQWLREYRQLEPHGTHLEESYFLEATLRRTLLADCAGALVAYERYLRTPGRFSEQARVWRDWCRDRRDP